MYLLDTHALVWGVTVPEQLPVGVRKILASGEVTVSVVSYWELILKKGRQTAPVAEPKVWWDRYITRLAVEVLPVRVAHLDQLDALPDLHRDPFDRILVAQALARITRCSAATAPSPGTAHRYSGNDDRSPNYKSWHARSTRWDSGRESLHIKCKILRITCRVYLRQTSVTH